MNQIEQLQEEYLTNLPISEEQKIFIKCYSFDRMKFKEIEKELQKLNKNIKYSDIQKLNIDCKYFIDEIQKVRNKFSKKRKEDNENFESFLLWYSKEVKNASCGYCGVTQKELNEIFVENQLLPLNEKAKRASGSLEIERKDSKDNSYHISNLILSCPLCNNAKSNLIDEESWRKFFVLSMREYYKTLLKRDLTNKI